MSANNNFNLLIFDKKNNDYNSSLSNFEKEFISVIKRMGLPVDNIFVPANQRLIVFKNANEVLSNLKEDIIHESNYISKFFAAVAAGLFDAALNYLWNETIIELRKRISNYDISYFFDNANLSSDEKKSLRIEDDLCKLDDYKLIQGARNIEIISEIGYKHLDFIRYMRNWTSAAHPNNSTITGLNLISWLETCIIEVIKLPYTDSKIKIKKLLSNIRSKTLSDQDAIEISLFFNTLNRHEANTLMLGFFGIYTREDTSQETRQNINLLALSLWQYIDIETKHQIGRRHASFANCGEIESKDYARRFLDLVDGLSFITEGMRSVEVSLSLTELKDAHRASNNFYSEPIFAKKLLALVGENGNSIKNIDYEYVTTIIECYITNGNGKAWNAEPYYLSLINKFNEEQALIALLSFKNEIIAIKLQHELCKNYFIMMIENLLLIKFTNESLKDICNKIIRLKNSLNTLKDDSSINKSIRNISLILPNLKDIIQTSGFN
ncbi:hypothetical protein [Fluviispira vulneris]|uniref:hypothetical protein n=1 Tax=Fluviispira vulneris TaxID=2763012 RepID=UPI00164931E7|nr:hypothetical protein [Fluviispira vulneris]